MERELERQIVNAVMSRLSAERFGGEEAPPIPVEVSGRHVHFSKEHFQELFGIADMEKAKDISQPGQFLSSHRVRLIGPKGAIDRVAVLGPFRKATQVEVSLTDAVTLGISPPIRQSGNISGSADIHVQVGGKILFLPSCTIVAARHLHMTPEDAAVYGVIDGQMVDVLVEGSRPLVMRGVLVRAEDTGALGLHIDFDEANAAGVRGNAYCRILRLPFAEPGETIGRSASAKEERLVAASRGKTALLTEKMAESFHKEGVREIHTEGRVIITALARDSLKRWGITVR